jgi:hypothetical protein
VWPAFETTWHCDRDDTATGPATGLARHHCPEANSDRELGEKEPAHHR